mmetsp:Transcript_11017/g.23548  ORF Transcript_11017/g.23548 Transcript_11017/m.23548 type:complete len:330 (+) Transcript_11017:266-1255(+)|eukprot:CAMPEP_0183727978 /NCGR_PEP_ID=MMETSP0737-20130205/26924_1 /TAXON_ID=385413 /ORGANISM="Thalassiosira miniscula, Strain CCMP1093" /LENGTH=329 /DNA_ID=CAMNT_0025959779 /DNA_START=143 /DNA_END=1132 /DNA_ORIENTATION=+
MCIPDNTTTASLKRRSSSLLLTHESFVFDDLPDKDDATKRTAQTKGNPYVHGLNGPSLASTLLTVSFYVACLFLLEHLTRLGIATFAHVDPVLESERNRAILARHLAVDFVSLFCCAYVAITNRHSCKEIIKHGLSYGTSDDMPEGGFEERVFAYRPGAQRLMMLFFVYQVKNMYDTIVWGDGIEFVLHHIFAGAAAWGGMFPGCCHFYAFFYFGFSEVSTAILCLLANFDPEFGVEGLDAVFPKTKIVLGTLFVTSFIVCRLILWPFWSYHFMRDTLAAIRSKAPRAEGRRGYLRLIIGCLVGLSFIQLVFVYMIVQIGKEELEKLMG